MNSGWWKHFPLLIVHYSLLTIKVFNSQLSILNFQLMIIFFDKKLSFYLFIREKALPLQMKTDKNR